MTSSNDPQHHSLTEELVGDYETECTYCGTKRKLSEYTSVGWKLGEIIGRDSANPEFGRCYKCLSHALKVIRVPGQAPVPDVIGFTTIPQK